MTTIESVSIFKQAWALTKATSGSRGLGLRCLPSMREVLGSNPLGGNILLHFCNILCSPSPSEETINRGPNTPIPTMHALICEELKDHGIPPKVVP